MIKLKNTLFAVFVFTFLFAYSQEIKKEMPFLFKWDNGFKLESADKNFKLKFGGRIMVDHAFFNQDSDLDAVFGELETENGAEFRRARFFTSGTIYRNVEFKLQLDFANGKTVLKDAYLGVKNIPIVGNFRVGHVKEPFRLSVLTSSKYISFMEVGPNVSFSQERNNGIVFFNDFLNKRLSVQAGIFRNSDETANDLSANDGYSFTTRVTGLLLNNKEDATLLHLGLGYSYRKKDSKEYKISSRPKAHLSSVKYISTRTIEDVDNVNLVNIETALVLRSFSFQGEYIFSNVNTGTISAIDNYNFSAYYGQVSYFLTGEHKNYKNSYSGFDRVKPKHNFGGDNKGAGAWEVALRYSNSDLNSKDVLGGEQSDITLGVNWHLNPATRIMLNHVWVDVENAGKANIFQARFQIDF